jgi:hypothetical protein
MELDAQAMNAQNQHYVPKFILRNFLAETDKEQVAVYDKQEDRSFTTSIKNIMAERRFHDFKFEDWVVSFENIACRIEDHVLPVYGKVVAQRRLDKTPEETAALALLMAFQLIRTKEHRDLPLHLDDLLRQKIESHGGRIEDIQGYKPLPPEELKKLHLREMKNQVGEYTKILAEKDFLLQASSPGRSFYLGDHPVCMHNQLDLAPCGNIGLAVRGIEIYLPLASDLTLCAFCPSVLSGLRRDLEAAKTANDQYLSGEVMAGRMSGADMKARLTELKSSYRFSEGALEAFCAGTPCDAVDTNMGYFNSLQVRYRGNWRIDRTDLFQSSGKVFCHRSKRCSVQLRAKQLSRHTIRQRVPIIAADTRRVTCLQQSTVGTR